MPTLYLDTCALNRLTDDQTQPRIFAEAEAVNNILNMVSSGEVRWIASSVLHTELARNPRPFERSTALRLLEYASHFIRPSPEAVQRAQACKVAGYGSVDALHLALAEQASVDALLTVDDRFLKRAARNLGNPVIPILNPIDWLQGRRPWLLKQ